MQCHNFIFKQGMKMTQKSFMSLMENDNDDESFNPKLSFELKCLLRCLIAVQMSEHSTTIRLFVSNQLLIGFCLFVTHNFSNFTFPFLYFYPIFFAIFEFYLSIFCFSANDSYRNPSLLYQFSSDMMKADFLRNV